MLKKSVRFIELTAIIMSIIYACDCITATELFEQYVVLSYILYTVYI